MIKRNIYQLTVGFCSMLLLMACDKVNSVLDVGEVEYVKLKIEAIPVLSNIESTAGLKVVLENYTEKYRIEKVLATDVLEIDSIIPGNYTITISGELESGLDRYYLNGSMANRLLMPGSQDIQIPVDGAKVGPLAISEIFYAGTSPFYFRNQFYEITNNSDETVYVDGLYFANLHPTIATTTLPVWPAADKNTFVYAQRIWKIPGSGRDYPLQPGASFTIAQFAANHKLPQYNPDSPIDASLSEFEFNMDNPNFPDQPALDMQHVFYNGRAAKGGVPQYLTSVFGAAYVIFRVPQGEIYDPATDTDLQTRDLGTTSAMLYAKIPVKYVMDGVEAGHNESMIAAKRMASVLDAGMTWVGATYNSRGVRRKKVGTRADGSPILMDTNNSTEDFERQVVPAFRYYKQGVPTWSRAH
jgi:hypothetical protein